MRKGNCRSRASSTGFRAASLICAVALTTSHCVTSSTAYLFALPRIACYQQLRRAGDPAHGDGAQNLGRQSNGDRRPHAADFGQRLTHLLAARQGCLWPVGEVTALCSTHLAGNRPHRTITLSGPATCSTPARSTAATIRALQNQSSGIPAPTPKCALPVVNILKLPEPELTHEFF